MRPAACFLHGRDGTQGRTYTIRICESSLPHITSPSRTIISIETMLCLENRLQVPSRVSLELRSATLCEIGVAAHTVELLATTCSQHALTVAAFVDLVLVSHKSSSMLQATFSAVRATELGITSPSSGNLMEPWYAMQLLSSMDGASQATHPFLRRQQKQGICSASTCDESLKCRSTGPAARARDGHQC